MTASLLCCGLTTIDITQEVSSLPGADEKVVARATRVDVGGPAANAARSAAALGSDVDLITALGSGPLAGLARTILADDGVTVTDLATGGGDLLPVSSVFVSADGERAVASTNATHAGMLREPPMDLGRTGGCVLVDGHLLETQVQVAGASKAAGVPVVLDGGSWKPGLEVLLERVDMAVVSANFAVPETLAQHWPGDVLDVVQAMGPGDVAVSRGAGAIEVLTASGRHEIDVATVTAVDTLGAGDVLHGSLAHEVGQGRSFVSALERASQMATHSVQYPGVMGWRSATSRSPRPT